MNQQSKATYRAHFTDQEKAQEYDLVQYARGSYSEVCWEIERDMLAAFAAEFRATHPRIDYLDFASGTGRIIAFMQDKVDAATGIEVSPAMADRAESKLKNARIIRADITPPGAEIEGKYDLITTFRFVLNAEPALRLAAMKALAARLRDHSSRLVFNNHGYLWSLKLLPLPLHILRHGLGWRPEGNVMSNAQVRRLAHDAGLEIIRIQGYGVLSAKLLKFVSHDRAVRIERALANAPILRRLGANQLYIARLRH